MDKSIIRTAKSRENPYVMLARALLHDKRLSFKGKGLLSYLLSLPDDWVINVAHLTTVGLDGRDSVNTGIKELAANGYLIKTELPREVGRFSGYEYTVCETPIDVTPPPADSENLEESDQNHRDGKSVTAPQRVYRSGLTAAVNPQLLINDLPSNELLNKSLSLASDEKTTEPDNLDDLPDLPEYTPPTPDSRQRKTWEQLGLTDCPEDWIQRVMAKFPHATVDLCKAKFSAIASRHTNDYPHEQKADWYMVFESYVSRDSVSAPRKPVNWPSKPAFNGHSDAQTDRMTESPQPALSNAIAAFSGLDLITFKKLKARMPDITQAQITQQAAESGCDVLVLMQNMLKGVA
ncbi:MAG: hypothetical protein RLY58_2246 [Pseudomonadota bacterium]|jgi:hypothetical protein